MKIPKKKYLLIALLAVVICVLAAVFVLIKVNTYSLELSISDGEKIYLEYGKDKELPEVTAVYKGTLFNKKGTSVEVQKEGKVDFQKLGEYQVTYTAEYKRRTASATEIIVIEDKTPPAITLQSDPESYTLPNAEYVEEGFSAVDNYDGDITEQVIRQEKDGVVTYQVSDSSGNEAVVTRTIVYNDPNPPVITLNGDSEIALEIGTNYAEPGFTAMDDCDGDITQKVEIKGTVDIDKTGDYVLTYRVTDSYENICEVTRTVKVADRTAPVLTLQGKKNIYVKIGESYSEPGFTAIDQVDGDLTSKVSVSGGVDINQVGSYTITYTAKDAAGNISTAERSVYVYEKQAENAAQNPGDKVVYLTFDDGPGPYTAQLLDILDKYGVKVTFFVTNQKPDYQNLIGEEYRRGHTIALHTYSHNYSQIYKSQEDYYKDLSLISDLCVAQTGTAPTIVRFPGGSSNAVSKKYCTGIMTSLTESLSYHGYLYCDWNVSSGDAGGVNTSDGVAANVISGIQKKNVSIVLQHDVKKFSVEAVEEIICWGLANGYTFLPMTESTPMVHHGVNN